MIASAIIDEIKRLLAENRLSQRKISLRLGVSRGTVGAIARGTRPDYKACRKQRGDEFPALSGHPERCPGCGGMVQMPCLACRVRAIKWHWRTSGATRGERRRPETQSI